MMRKIVYLLGLFLGLEASSQETFNLRVIIRNFESTEGKVRIGLYHGEEDYMNKVIARIDTIVYDKDSIEILFKGILKGNYAFSLYHDKNNNGELDTNFIGIPIEDYAFSNNADGTFGPPDYGQCAFDLEQDMTQTITIN